MVIAAIKNINSSLIPFVLSNGMGVTGMSSYIILHTCVKMV